jgi:ATP-dependent protease ClpP protease subunit
MTDLAGKKTAYYSFTGVIDQNGATRIASAFNAAVNNSCDEVYFCFNSLGGYVGDGVFLYNHIRALPLRTIAHNTGSLMSIAVAVFVGAEERYCSRHSMFMIHPTTLGPFQEAIPWERLDAGRSAALADDARTENILRERANIPDEILSARRVKDVHITPDEALKFGLVHGVSEFSLPNGQEILQV